MLTRNCAFSAQSPTLGCHFPRHSGTSINCWPVSITCTREEWRIAIWSRKTCCWTSMTTWKYRTSGWPPCLGIRYKPPIRLELASHVWAFLDCCFNCLPPLKEEDKFTPESLNVCCFIFLYYFHVPPVQSDVSVENKSIIVWSSPRTEWRAGSGCWTRSAVRYRTWHPRYWSNRTVQHRPTCGPAESS